MEAQCNGRQPEKVADSASSLKECPVLHGIGLHMVEERCAPYLGVIPPGEEAPCQRAPHQNLHGLPQALLLHRHSTAVPEVYRW